MSLEIIETKKGAACLIINSHRYRKSRESKKRVTWRCCTEGCKSTCKTDLDRKELLVKPSDHVPFHDPPATRDIDYDRARTAVKRKAEDPQARASKIVCREAVKYPTLTYADTSGLTQAFKRKRSSQLPSSSNAMDDNDWEPLSESDLKLLQARRERADKVSKLMGDYLLKGYKMLATTCPECDTILLQTRQGKNYCVACTELDSDVDKDDPVLNQSAAMSMAREVELASAAAAPASTASPKTSRMANARLSSPIGATPSAPTNQIPPLSLSETNSNRPKPKSANSEQTKPNSSESANSLGMTSIDVQCWPSNPSEHNTSRSVLQTARSALGIKTEFGQLGGDGDSGLGSVYSSAHGMCEASGLPTPTSQPSQYIQTLVDKVQWASQELRQTGSVEYSIQLCQLIKTASEAVVAVRTARI